MTEFESGFYEKKVAPKMFEQKHMSFDWQLKSIDEYGVFAGYGSVFEVVDSQKDVVMPGAFKNTIENRKSQIKLLWQHDMSQPIGVIDEIFEDENGLYVKGHLMLDVAKAKEAYALLQKGVVSGMSIGYSPKRTRSDKVNGVRILDEVELWEVSLVTFPANDAARITVVKNAEKPDGYASKCEEYVKLSAALQRAAEILS